MDKLVLRAASHKDQVIKVLANTIRERRPPKLLKEVCVFERNETQHHAGTTFKHNCKHKLKNLAEEFDIPLGQFLICETPPLMLEQRGGRLSEKQARDLQPEEKEELIKVFLSKDEDAEPVSIVSVKHSIAAVCSNHFFQSFRLYLVRDPGVQDDTVNELCESVQDWDRS